MRETIL